MRAFSWPSLAVCVLLSLSLNACGSKSPTQPKDSDDARRPPVGYPVYEEGILAVKMRAARPQQPPFATAPLEREIAALVPSASGAGTTRRVSFEETDLFKRGADFDPLLPNQNVSAGLEDPNAGAYIGTANGGIWKTSDMAYATYSFALSGYADSGREQTIGFNWVQGGPETGSWFVGLANQDTLRWDWYAGEVDNVVTIFSYAPYQFGDGSVRLILVLRGDFAVELDSLQVGAFETRGTGGDTTPFSPPADPYPDFPLQNVDAVDLTDDCGPVGDQLNSGSCTAWAATGAENYELQRIYGDCGWDLNLPAFRLSPRYVYITTGNGGGCPSGGRAIYGTATWMVDNGAAREVTVPFVTTELEPPPDFPTSGFHCNQSWNAATAAAEAALFRPDFALLIATQNPVSEDYALSNQDLDDARWVIKTLRRPLGMNTILDNNFSIVDHAGGESWTFAGPPGGTSSHAMLIVGYDNNRNGGSFKVKNSWGTNWGDNGYGWITYDSMQNENANAYVYMVADTFNQQIADDYCPMPPPFLPPFDLTVPALHNDRIEFSWQPAPGAEFYFIYRDDQSMIYDTVSAGTSYTDFNVPDNLTHVYWVRGQHPGDGPGPFSDPLLAYKEPMPQ